MSPDAPVSAGAPVEGGSRARQRAARVLQAARALLGRPVGGPDEPPLLRRSRTESHAQTAPQAPLGPTSPQAAAPALPLLRPLTPPLGPGQAMARPAAAAARGAGFAQVTKLKLELGAELGAVRVLQWPNGVCMLTGRTLERGAFGKVRLGIRLHDQSVLAIKEFRPRLEPAPVRQAPPCVGPQPPGRLRPIAPRSVAAIRQEYEAAARYSHALQPQDAYALTGKPALGYSMRAMAGCLSDALSFDAPGPRRTVAVALADQVGAELARLRAQGAVHGDVKLPNVLFDLCGHLCLCDFGGVQPLQRDGRLLAGACLATLPPPEAGGPLGPEMDVWALGASLWLLLAPNLELSRIVSHQGGGPGRSPELLAWRGQLLAGAYEARPPANNSPEQALCRAFDEACAADERLARFVVVHMLAPAQQRCSANDVAQFAAGLTTRRRALHAALLSLARVQPFLPEMRRLQAVYQKFCGPTVAQMRASVAAGAPQAA